MTEQRLLLRHASTVLVGQLAVMAFGITDTWVAGRYADTALAALSVASATYITVHISLMGVLQALMPLWAQLHGANRPRALGESVHQALYLWVLTSGLAIGLLLSPGPLLAWTDVPLALQSEVREYLAIVAIAAPASLLFRLYGSFNQALGLPRLVTVLQVGALLVKIPLSVLLVMGWPGIFEPMGLAGCAWATVVVNYLMVGAALYGLRTDSIYHPYALWRRWSAPHGPSLLRFLRLGLPGGLTIAVEVTSFTLVALFVARLGVVASASHQILANMAAVLYMIPLSLAIASSARISQWLGAREWAQARHSLWTSLRLVLGASALMAIVVGVGREAIARFYTPSPEVFALARAMLGWLALYHVVDALQVFLVFTLRCFRITVLPLLVYTILLWGVGLRGGYLLAYSERPGDAASPLDLPWLATQSPLAFWQTAIVALGLTCAILGPRLWLSVRRLGQTS